MILVSAIFILGMAPSSWATSYSGSITGPGGTLTGTNEWIDASLAWTVTNTDGYWTYVYTFTVGEKGISHVIIEVSDSFGLGNIKEGTTSNYELNTYGSQGASNPGMPEPIHGIKWESGSSASSELSWIWTIVTDREPMWGDFYAKDGVDGTVDVYAYNIGFGSDATAIIGDGNAGGWVLVPDTGTPPIPEPASILLLGFGLASLAGVRKRFKKA